MCFIFMPRMFIYKAKCGKLKMLVARIERKSCRAGRGRKLKGKVKKFNLLFAGKNLSRLAVAKWRNWRNGDGEGEGESEGEVKAVAASGRLICHFRWRKCLPTLGRS